MRFHPHLQAFPKQNQCTESVVPQNTRFKVKRPEQVLLALFTSWMLLDKLLHLYELMSIPKREGNINPRL